MVPRSKPIVRVNSAALFPMRFGDFHLEPQMPEIHRLQAGALSHLTPGAVGSHNDPGCNPPPGGNQGG